jgi:hypothetical protein
MNDNITDVAISPDGKYWVASSSSQICYSTANGGGCE